MKKLILLFFAIIFCFQAYCQYQCLYVPNYTYIKNENLIEIKKPFVVCFDKNYLSYYSEQTGTITIKIEQPINRSVDASGVVTESIINLEDPAMSRGYLSIDIVYGVKKTIVINNTRNGNAVILTGEGFVGSKSNTFIDHHIKIPKE
jgi:hypothetical protein